MWIIVQCNSSGFGVSVRVKGSKSSESFHWQSISHKEERCPQFLQLLCANSRTDDAGGWVFLALRERWVMSEQTKADVADNGGTTAGKPKDSFMIHVWEVHSDGSLRAWLRCGDPSILESINNLLGIFFLFEISGLSVQFQDLYFYPWFVKWMFSGVLTALPVWPTCTLKSVWANPNLLLQLQKQQLLVTCMFWLMAHAVSNLSRMKPLRHLWLFPPSPW